MIQKVHESNESMIDSTPSTISKYQNSTERSPDAPHKFPDCSYESVKEVKPFFIMDWLEQVDPKDLLLAQHMLSPQNKKQERTDESLSNHGSLTPLRKNLFSSMQITPTRKEATESSRKTSSAYYKRSVAIGNKYNARGIQHATRGNWKGALSCWEDALEIRSQIHGESLDVANTCNNIGIALGKLSRYDEAVTSLQRALTIRTEYYGRNHEVVAATLHNVGNVFQESGDLHSAIECFRESETIQEHIFGRAHAEVARSLIAIGHTYCQANATSDARRAYLDALKIFDEIGFEATHPEVQAVVKDVKELEVKIRDA